MPHYRAVVRSLLCHRADICHGIVQKRPPPLASLRCADGIHYPLLASVAARLSHVPLESSIHLATTDQPGRSAMLNVCHTTAARYTTRRVSHSCTRQARYALRRVSGHFTSPSTFGNQMKASLIRNPRPAHSIQLHREARVKMGAREFVDFSRITV